jgi:phage-related protein/DNA-binding XRE family transcriptional regulator
LKIPNGIVAREIESLPKDFQPKFLRISSLIEQLGLAAMREPYVKHLRDKLWEMRMKGRDGIARALYIAVSGKRVVVLRAFIKKTQKTRVGAGTSKGDPMTIPFDEFKRRLLANPAVKAEYDRLGPGFEIAAELLRARLRSGLSQEEIAERMGTSQSAIARLESGQTLPSTKTLLRYAQATGSKVEVRLSAA